MSVERGIGWASLETWDGNWRSA